MLPNPRDWVAAARAYLTLEREWPQYDRQLATNRLDAIIEVGQKLQTALSTLSKDTVDGSLVRDNEQFYGKLIDNYEAKASALAQALQVMIDEYQNKLRIQGQLVGAIDFWGGAYQNTGYSRAIPLVGSCGGTSINLPTPLLAPATLWTRAPQPFGVGEQLRLGNFEACFENVSAIDVHDYYNDLRWYYVYAKLHAVLRLTYQGATVLRWAYTSPEIVFHFNSGGHCYPSLIPCPNPPSFTKTAEQVLNENWTQNWNIKGWMESTLPDYPDAAFEPQVAAAVTAKLQARALAALSESHDSLSAGGSRYMFTRELAGAKALLDAFIQLGLPRAYDADELLRALIAGDTDTDSCAAITTGSQVEWRVLASNRVIDERLLQALLDCGVRTPAARLDLYSPMQQRAETLRTTINKHLALIDAGAYQEGYYAIDATLRDLQVRRQLKRFPPPGSITGTAFRDNNRNGQADTGEPAMSGVTLFIDTNNNSQIDRGEKFDDRNNNNWPDSDELFDDRNYNWRRDEGERWATTTADGRSNFARELAGFHNICAVPPTGYVVIGSRCKQTLVTFNANTSIQFGLAPPRVMLPLIMR